MSTSTETDMYSLVHRCRRQQKLICTRWYIYVDVLLDDSLRVKISLHYCCRSATPHDPLLGGALSNAGTDSAESTEANAVSALLKETTYGHSQDMIHKPLGLAEQQHSHHLSNPLHSNPFLPRPPSPEDWPLVAKAT